MNLDIHTQQNKGNIMALVVTLTNAEINDFRGANAATQQKVIQGSDLIPISVDLSAEITLGLAILTAIAASSDLDDALGNIGEKEILEAITSIAFVNPTEPIAVLAYATAATHRRVVPIDEVTYLPFVRLWRNYVDGGATAVVLDVGIAL